MSISANQPKESESITARRNEAPEQAGIKSVEIVGRILRAFTENRPKFCLKQIAQSAGMPAAKLHRYLVSMLRIGLVKQGPNDNCYALGSFALQVGSAAARSSTALQDATRKLHELRRIIDETITLSVWTPQGPVILEVEESSRPIAITMRRGTVLSVLGSATGLVFCAHMPRAHTAPLIGRDFEADDAVQLARNPGELENLLEVVRTQSYALSPNDPSSEIATVATPVFDVDGALVAVLSIIGNADRIAPSRSNDVLKALRAVANIAHA